MRLTCVLRTLMISLFLATAVLGPSRVVPPSSSAASLDCFQLSASPSSFLFSSAGGSGTIFVNNPQGCSWNANTYYPWIFITNQFNGNVSFSVSSNPGPARVGTITIDTGTNSVSVQIEQQGIPTVSFYRYWNAGIYNHYYTTDFSELGNGANGYVFERVEGHVYSSQVSGTVPLKRYYCADNGDHFYTTNPNEPGSGLPCYQLQRSAMCSAVIHLHAAPTERNNQGDLEL
jgi:hypothetical protein